MARVLFFKKVLLDVFMGLIKWKRVRIVNSYAAKGACELRANLPYCTQAGAVLLKGRGRTRRQI
jgi:hypothetical protein